MPPLRFVIWFLGALLIGVGLGLWAGGPAMLGVFGIAAGLLALAAAVLVSRAGSEGPTEPGRIEDVDPARRKELIRGTSMHLRDMKYRYSLRYDRSGREPFTAEINTVILGFVPAIILDNRSDKQGYGYVAFPYDGSRWRGPGLPCPGDRGDAIEHAARCVAPLEEE